MLSRIPHIGASLVLFSSADHCSSVRFHGLTSLPEIAESFLGKSPPYVMISEIIDMPLPMSTFVNKRMCKKMMLYRPISQDRDTPQRQMPLFAPLQSTISFDDMIGKGCGEGSNTTYLPSIC